MSDCTRAHRRRVGDPPEPMTLARGDRVPPRSARRGLRRAPELAVGIAHQHEQQADVGGRGLQQLQPIELRPGVRALVGQHHAPRVVADLAQRDEARPRHRPAHPRCTSGRTDRSPARSSARPHSLGQPAVEHRTRLARTCRAASSRADVDADDVVRAHRVEPLLRLGADLIVRGRDDRRDVASRVAAVSVAAKRLDLHGSRRTTPRQCQTKSGRSQGRQTRVRGTLSPTILGPTGGRRWTRLRWP